MSCPICYELNPLQNSDASKDINDLRTEYYLSKSLDELIKSAQTGCDICDVLSKGLLHVGSSMGIAKGDGMNFSIGLLIPGQASKYNRVRAKVLYQDTSMLELGPIDLEFYCTRPSTSEVTPWARYGHGNFVEKGIDARTLSGKIKAWLDNCTTHSKCAIHNCNDTMPTRVIDLYKDEKNFHVVELGNEIVQYVALSYCWGGDSIPKNTSTRSSQVWDEMIIPTAFHEVARLCRLLDIKYLWIDALCILQDDEEDWEHESSKMFDYYNGAYLVIATNHASAPSQGIFIDRKLCGVIRPNHTSDQEIVFRNFSPHLACDQQKGLHKSTTQIDQISPLDCRAWALQERFSSRRIVHIYDNEVVWECDSEVLCECGMLTSKNQRLEDGSTSLRFAMTPESLKSSSEQLFLKWSSLIERFSSCLLTRDEDRLPATSGLAQRFARSGLREYRAGLWNDFMPQSLLWRVKDPFLSRYPSPAIAPSWSWASLVGAVEWNLCQGYDLADLTGIIFCQTKLSSKDPFGKVSGGLLKLRGRTLVTEVEYQPSTGSMTLASNEAAYFDMIKKGGGSSKQRSAVKCILIAQANSESGRDPSRLLAMVVERVRPEMNNAKLYKRIGVASLDTRHLNDFKLESLAII